MRPWWPWRARWQAVIVGRESGRVSELGGLITFRRLADGAQWCARMNSRNGDRPLTVWELRPLP